MVTIDGDEVFMSFAGKRHSGNAATRGERLVLTVWKNGILYGDGDEQQIVIEADLLDSVARAVRLGREAIARAAERNQ